ncbi:alpha/beta hydrolase family esterase [Thermodesulfobacteriota bacterium]
MPETDKQAVMKMKLLTKYIVAISISILLTLLALICPGDGAASEIMKKTIEHDGRSREYYMHVPSSYHGMGVPLVLVFHGGGGTAERFARYTGFNEISEENGFIVVYPQGINSHWNDGRKSEKFRQQNLEVDDVAFIMELIKRLKKEYFIDDKRIFATGMSNGGFICQRLAIEKSHHFAAVASVTAQVSEPLVATFKPREKISVLIMNGTDDPLVPYGGGEIVLNFPFLAKSQRQSKRGRVISTDKTIQLWIEHNRISSPPVIEQLPDVDKNDGSTVERSEWSDRREHVSVVLYKIIGGGHTYPGGFQYLPKRLIGTTCRDMDASEVIWKFFSKHGKR